MDFAYKLEIECDPKKLHFDDEDPRPLNDVGCFIKNKNYFK